LPSSPPFSKKRNAIGCPKAHNKPFRVLPLPATNGTLILGLKKGITPPFAVMVLGYNNKIKSCSVCQIVFVWLQKAIKDTLKKYEKKDKK
jgi:hypothetical protein